ncbi:MAG: hypothetical protein ABEJ42_08170 [Halobacteriaceae archaeon]
MTGRGVSTVVDVSLCLLLVGASVGVLVAAPDRHSTDPPSPRPVATVLGTATGSVPVDAPGGRATVREPLAGLLASAAAKRGDEGARPFVRAVRERLVEALSSVSGPVQVIATAPDGGRVVVGPSPPPGVTVAAVSLAVPTGARGLARVTVRRWSP